MDNKIEPAPTGRAKCRACREAIGKGAYRFGEAAVSQFSDGEQLLWYHLECAVDKRPVELKATLERFTGELPGRAELEARLANAADLAKLSSVVRAERAPTGRAHCQQCHEAIEKATLRVAIEREVDGRVQNVFVHAKCARVFVGADGLWKKLGPKAADLTEAERTELDLLVCNCDPAATR